MTSPLPYNGLALDRAAALRGDAELIAGVLARPQSVVIPLWQDKCLVAGPAGAPVLMPAGQSAELITAAGTTSFLGLNGPAGVFAVDLSALTADAAAGLAGASGAVDVRRLFGSLDPQLAATLAYARGILRWHRQQRYCGACGSPAVSENGGSARRCTAAGCEQLMFPRVEPAVIMLVESAGPPRRCLLARHAASLTGEYATLAGFVELGECLEDAVRREVAEETGVRVGAVRYQASQAWPFPAGLMVGFRAAAQSEQISIDPAEIAEARWFTRQEVAGLLASQPGTGDSIEEHLLRGWLAEAG
ncbi:MAG TPA: NAD(+) diphosphatase [Streptosporangiaceae bacterium]